MERVSRAIQTRCAKGEEQVPKSFRSVSLERLRMVVRAAPVARRIKDFCTILDSGQRLEIRLQ